MDTRRPARKTPDERDGEIRGAARAIALEQGLVAVTQRAVAARIGVAPALVTHYRSSMEGLVADTFRAIVGAELDEVREATHEGTARERLRALVTTALDPSRDAVTAVWVDAWSLGRRNAALAAAVREQADAWQRHAEHLVAAGVAAGEFAEVEPAPIAWLLLGLVDGLNAQSVIHDRHDPRRAAVVLSAVERELGVAPEA